jgi:hypothetical protein
MKLLNYLFNPGPPQRGQSVRLQDYVSGTEQGDGVPSPRMEVGRAGNAFDAQEAQRDYSSQGWAFDHMEGGFGGFGGLGGREFDTTQDEPWSVDLWRDE